jgi:hypothetical protein
MDMQFPEFELDSFDVDAVPPARAGWVALIPPEYMKAVGSMSKLCVHFFPVAGRATSGPAPPNT